MDERASYCLRYMLLMSFEKRVGPRIKPWGTPFVIGSGWNSRCSDFIHCTLWEGRAVCFYPRSVLTAVEEDTSSANSVVKSWRAEMKTTPTAHTHRSLLWYSVKLLNRRCWDVHKQHIYSAFRKYSDPLTFSTICFTLQTYSKID
jgi:hypothetical protein